MGAIEAHLYDWHEDGDGSHRQKAWVDVKVGPKSVQLEVSKDRDVKKPNLTLVVHLSPAEFSSRVNTKLLQLLRATQERAARDRMHRSKQRKEHNDYARRLRKMVHDLGGKPPWH